MKRLFNLTDSLRNKDGVGFVSKSGLPLKGMLLPNIDDLRVVTRIVDEFAKAFNIDRVRLREFEYKPMLEVHKPNAYLLEMFDRLNRYAKAGDAKKFETLHNRMLKHSISLQMLSLHKVESRWYKRLPYWYIETVMKKVQRLVNSNSTRYKYKRVLIPKEIEGQFRPLAVPPLEWRVLANMRYTLLWIWLRNRQPWASQHGARPERGVTSCWRALKDIILNPKYKDIYEFDLSKFFDRVDTKYALFDALEWKRVPKSIARWVLDTCRNAVGNQTYQELILEWDTIKSSIKNDMRVPPTFRSGDLGKTAKDKGFGVPQGFSLSPIAACLCVEFMFCTHRNTFWLPDKSGYVHDRYRDNVLMYMDDGIIFGENLSEFDMYAMSANFSWTGTEINEEKSKWLKRNGVWQVEKFKFLGIEYLVKENTIKALTRKGAEKKFPLLDISKLDLHGPSGRVFIRYAEKSHPLVVAEKYGIFDTIIADLFCDGKRFYETSSGHLVANPNSWVSYYCDEEGLNVQNASSHALNNFGEYLVRRRSERRSYFK